MAELQELQNLLNKLVLARVIGNWSKIELYADGSGAMLNIDSGMDEDDATIFAQWSGCLFAVDAVRTEMKRRGLCMAI